MDQQSHERVLKRLHTRVQKLISESFSVTSDQKLAIDQLADLQDQIGSLDQRMNAIREEVISIQNEAVDEGDLSRALTVFAPVWESLSPREQIRIIRLLVERVGHDGRDGRGSGRGLKRCAVRPPSETLRGRHETSYTGRFSNRTDSAGVILHLPAKEQPEERQCPIKVTTETSSRGT